LTPRVNLIKLFGINLLVIFCKLDPFYSKMKTKSFGVSLLNRFSKLYYFTTRIFFSPSALKKSSLQKEQVDLLQKSLMRLTPGCKGLSDTNALAFLSLTKKRSLIGLKPGGLRGLASHLLTKSLKLLHCHCRDRSIQRERERANMHCRGIVCTK
jgi:hypothetical protein